MASAVPQCVPGTDAAGLDPGSPYSYRTRTTRRPHDRPRGRTGDVAQVRGVRAGGPHRGCARRHARVAGQREAICLLLSLAGGASRRSCVPCEWRQYRDPRPRERDVDAGRGGSGRRLGRAGGALCAGAADALRGQLTREHHRRDHVRRERPDERLGELDARPDAKPHPAPRDAAAHGRRAGHRWRARHRRHAGHAHPTALERDDGMGRCRDARPGTRAAELSRHGDPAPGRSRVHRRRLDVRCEPVPGLRVRAAVLIRRERPIRAADDHPRRARVGDLRERAHVGHPGHGRRRGHRRRVPRASQCGHARSQLRAATRAAHHRARRGFAASDAARLIEYGAAGRLHAVPDA